MAAGACFDFALLGAIVLLIILFGGEPDLMDVIISRWG